MGNWGATAVRASSIAALETGNLKSRWVPADPWTGLAWDHRFRLRIQLTNMFLEFGLYPAEVCFVDSWGQGEAENSFESFLVTSFVSLSTCVLSSIDALFGIVQVLNFFWMQFVAIASALAR